MNDTQHIPVYGEIVRGELSSAMHHLLGHSQDAHQGDYGSEEDTKHVVLHLNSPGGDLVEALTVINLMKALKIPITTVANVGVESAALLIFLAGDRRVLLPNSYGMAHHVSTDSSGSFHSLQDTLNHLKQLESSMMSIFKKNTSLSDDEIKSMLLGRQDFFMDAETMMKYGIGDIIVEPEDLVEVLENYGDIKKNKK